MNAFSPNGGMDENPTQPLDGTFHSGQSGVAEAGAGNIDKIRDILFGSNMRDYEQRFARLEEALKKESADLRETTQRSLQALEMFVSKELAALEARLNTERDERSNTDASIFKKIGEMENQEAQAQRELRNDLLQQSKELSDAIRNKSEELIALLDRRAAELQHSKTDRAALAGLLNEMALRLTDQFRVTAGD
jgi:DNA repair exonuclease SbcCD ATPase subunit